MNANDRRAGAGRRVYAAGVARRPILTPDRRLRVFVSSTLRELAQERVAAREAISSLHLAPVLFEQGARPHAPRDLYSAYVDQCDVFVGVYWQSYGWIAPGGTISGLEDEFNLGQGKPMLLYIKEPALEREDRLVSLIRRIEEEAGSAYRTFTTVQELGALVGDDLALLLTERFHADAHTREERSGLPARTTSFVGRDDELGELLRLLERGDVRLVTLTGTGGIGKTRLALEVARRLAPRFADGAAYVPLDRLTDPDLVPAAIAEAVGFPSLGPDQELGLADASGICSFCSCSTTSSICSPRLRSSPGCWRRAADSRCSRPAASRFDCRGSTRTRSPHSRVRRRSSWSALPPFVRTSSGTTGTSARRTRSVGAWTGCRSPSSLSRLLHGYCRRALSSSTSCRHSTRPRAVVDAPARQQTVRATIDWSYELLADHERDVFERLGVFGDSFTIEAARPVVGGDALAVLSSLSALVDKSLLVHAASESETRFRMIQAVSEYAAERLESRPDADAIRIAHADHYADFAHAAYAGLRGSEQRGWKEVLDLDRENVRRTLVELRASRAPRRRRGRRVVDAALLADRAIPRRAEARRAAPRRGGRALGRVASSSAGRGRRSRRPALGHRDRAAELGAAIEWFESHDDHEGRATALVGLGLATAPFDADHARELMRESAVSSQ